MIAPHDLLASYIGRARWFGGKGRSFSVTAVEAARFNVQLAATSSATLAINKVIRCGACGSIQAAR